MDIFSYIAENPEQLFLLRVSYLEIYNEDLHDLLNIDNRSKFKFEDQLTFSKGLVM